MEGIVFTGTMRPYAVTWDLESYRNAKKWKKINEAVGIRNELEKHTFCIWFNDSKTASTSRLDSRHIEFNCSHLLGVRLAEARPHAKRYGTMNVVDCYRMRVSSIIQIYIELNKWKLPESSGQMNTKQKNSKNFENGNFAGNLRFGENGAICRE